MTEIVFLSLATLALGPTLIFVKKKQKKKRKIQQQQQNTLQLGEKFVCQRLILLVFVKTYHTSRLCRGSLV